MGHLISYLIRRYHLLRERMQRQVRRIRDPHLFHLHYHRLMYDINTCSYCRQEFEHYWPRFSSARYKLKDFPHLLQNAAQQEKNAVTAGTETNAQVSSSVPEQATKSDTVDHKTLPRQLS